MELLWWIRVCLCLWYMYISIYFSKWLYCFCLLFYYLFLELLDTQIYERDRLVSYKLLCLCSSIPTPQWHDGIWATYFRYTYNVFIWGGVRYRKMPSPWNQHDEGFLQMAFCNQMCLTVIYTYCFFFLGFLCVFFMYYFIYVRCCAGVMSDILGAF